MKRITYQDRYEWQIMSPANGEAIFNAIQSSLPSLKRFMSWAHWPNSFEAALSYYRQFEEKTREGCEAHLVGFDKKKGACFGCGSLVPGSRLNPKAFDMGYWVSSSYQGQGFGTLTAKMLVYLGFNHFQADRLSVNCNPENKASLRVIEKCGFHFEGLLRNFRAKSTPEMLTNGYSPIQDALSFSLLPEDDLLWLNEMEANLCLE